MNMPLKPKYGTVSQLLLQLVVVELFRCHHQFKVSKSLAQKVVYKLSMHLRRLLNPMENNSDD